MKNNEKVKLIISIVKFVLILQLLIVGAILLVTKLK